MKLTANAEKILQKRYLKDGETVEEMFDRVARTITQNDPKYYSKFIEMLTNLEFIPGSPTLANAGRPLGALSSCYVIPIADSIVGIMQAVNEAATIFKTGGGVGYSFSSLRPKGSSVSSGLGVSSGPVDFMRMFDTMCDVIKQGGIRRGAQMAVLRVDHPDIEDFINCKLDLTRYTNFNISVHITDEFINAVKNNGDYPLKNAHTGEIRRVRAKPIWDQLVKAAWQTGDPGLLFLDRVNELDPLGNIVATNPCSELPLGPHDACNLGSINLSKLVEGDKFNENRFIDLIHLGTRFLDDVITENKYPLEEIQKTTTANRRIGLSLMGFADSLIKLGIAYDSEECLRFIDYIGTIFQNETVKASQNLAEERGAFSTQKNSKLQNALPIRNCTRTTLVPSGTVSIIAGCSAGIEPIFATIFERSHALMGEEKLLDVHPELEEYLGNLDGNKRKETMDQILNCNGSIQKVESLPDSLKKVLRTAYDVSPEWHIRVQAQWQKYIDCAISKTVNLQSSATVEDVAKIYLHAYEAGCKGVTVFRDGCRDGQQVFTTSRKKENKTLERPDSLTGFTKKVKTEFGNMYITINELENKPFEMFVSVGHGGTTSMADAEAVGRLVSLCFRSNISVEDIIKQLKGIGGANPVFNKGRTVKSIPDGVAYVLEHAYIKKEEGLAQLNKGICEDC